MSQPTKAQHLTVTALTSLSQTDLYSRMGDINTTYDTARAAYLDAQENLKVLLTEQISRHVTTAHPDADLVFFRAAADYHFDQHGERVEDCQGHNERLLPFEIVSADGVVLGGFDPLSPVMYLTERLSSIMGAHDIVLDVTTRTWAYDAN